MILLLHADCDIAEGIAQGLEGEGAEVQRDRTTDLSSMRGVRETVARLRPQAIVVPGGWDDADACETAAERAFAQNAENMVHVAAAAREFKATPVLVSTAEVFGGRGGPWMESDSPSPPCVWAQSRLKGEQFMTSAAPGSIVLRVGPMLGPRLTAERHLLRGVVEAAADELVSPVLASDVGRVVFALLEGGAKGLFHVAPNTPPVSRADLLRTLARAIGADPASVVGRPGRRLTRRAKMGRNSSLLADKLGRYFAAPFTSWREMSPSDDTPAPEEFTMGHRQSVKRVDKPWGHEIIWAHSDRYVGKVLFVKAGERLSLQYHEIKDETVFVLTGKMAFEVGPKDGEREDLIMKPGDSYRITPHTVHRMVAIEDTQILEASTPELDDVVRLEDKYGREGTSEA